MVCGLGASPTAAVTLGSAPLLPVVLGWLEWLTLRDDE